MWDLACLDWEDRIRHGRSLIPDLQLDVKTARQAVKIYNMLRLPDVPGTPALAEAGADWFRGIVAALFGSLLPATNERMIREVFNLVPKKNSKTTNGAAVMMTAMLMNKRPRAEFLLVGPTQAISERAFSQAVGMIDADDIKQRELDGKEGFLKRRFQVKAHLKEIVDRKLKSTLKVRTFDEKILTGSLPTGALIDELHLLGKIHYASSVIGQLRGGMLPIPESFLFFITTQSDQQPAGVFRAELMKARMIRDGKLTGVPTLPVLYEFPDDIHRDETKWKDPVNWAMVTPNNNKSITVDRLVADLRAAEIVGREEVIRWASQHLDIEIGIGLKSDRWVGAEFWPENVAPLLDLDALLAICDVVVIGLDGGGLDDLLGMAVLGRHRLTKQWLLWNHAWAHKSVLERRLSEASRFKDFINAGQLTLVETVGDDVIDVSDIIERIDQLGLLPEKSAIGVDPVGIGAIVDELASRGIDNSEYVRIVGVPQGWKLNGAIKTVERKLAGGQLIHGGQALMDYSVGNAKVDPHGNAVAITKQAAGSAKIDPLMATFNSAALMSMNPEAKGQSRAGIFF